jgi:hypothetical protein
MQYLICQEKEKILQFFPIFYFLFLFFLLKRMLYGNDIICKA